MKDEALKGAIGAEYQKSPWDEKGISMPPPEAPVQENSMIYKTFAQWANSDFLEVGEPRKKAYSKDELLLVEMGWNYGYDAGRAVEQALDKKAENARELGLDYEPDYKVTVVDNQHPNGVPLEQWGRVAEQGEERMKKLIKDLISAMEYHVEQTRPIHSTTVALQAAREAIRAQPAPVQEPLFWYKPYSGGMYYGPIHNAQIGDILRGIEEWIPLYTTPPASQRTWVGLTDEEIEKACVPLGAAMLSFTEVARAIEAKLRSKNHG